MTEQDDRLAALEAQLAQMVGEREREQMVKRASEELMTVVPPPKLSLHNAELQERQQRALEERTRAHQDWQRRYEEKLAKNAPQIERLQGQLGDITQRHDAENARHAEAVAELGRKRQGVLAQLAELERPPEMPSAEPEPERVRMWAA